MDLYHHGAETSHAADGQKSSMFFAVFLSVTLLHGRVCAYGVATMQFEFRNGFAIITAVCCIRLFLCTVRWLHHRMLKLKIWSNFRFSALKGDMQRFFTKLMKSSF